MLVTTQKVRLPSPRGCLCATGCCAGQLHVLHIQVLDLSISYTQQCAKRRTFGAQLSSSQQLQTYKALATIKASNLNRVHPCANTYLFCCLYSTEDVTAVLPYDLNDPAQLDLHPAYGTPAKIVGQVPFWKRLLWEGGRPIDAFLTIVSAQVRPCQLAWLSVPN